MSQNSEEVNRQRIAELEAENARLKQRLEIAMAERRELRNRLYGSISEADLPKEEEYLEMMRNHVPGSGMMFLERLGLLPRKSS